MQSPDVYRSEIAQHFGGAVAADDVLVKECTDMCTMHNLTVEELLYKWQALSYSNTSTLAIFTLESVPDLKARLQQELNKINALRQQKSAFCGPTNPWKGRPKRTQVHSVPGKIQDVVVKSEFSGPSRIVFRGPQSDEQSRKRRAYRYMYEKVTERSEVLDDRIDEFAELVQKHYHIDELADPSAATEETTTVVGRIVHDAEMSASGAKLNESSLVLESSRMMGSGVRVPMRFAPGVMLRGGIKGIGGISLFPGAIVALRGRNGGGGFFLVEEILSLPPVKIPPSPSSDSSANFSMFIACGPFSLDSDLDYKPWDSLFGTIKASKPAVVLLIGPFVDMANSRIKDGIIDRTPRELFEQQFTERLEDFLLHSPDSIVLVVPSVNDIISDHAVLPQCEFGHDFSNHSHIRLLPNPCRFSVNGVSFAVTSVDTLFHLRKEEFFRRTPEVDPLIPASEIVADSMANLARIVFQQRSFYPLFPAPFDLAHEVNLDVTHSVGIKLVDGEDEFLPDVLVLPSRLKHFTKVVDSTIVVNPSFLSKGTYAVLSYDGQGPGLVKDRITASISRNS